MLSGCSSIYSQVGLRSSRVRGLIYVYHFLGTIRVILLSARCKDLCSWTYSLPIHQLPTSFLPFSPMLSLNLYNDVSMFWRNAARCLHWNLSIPVFFCQAVVWCHKPFTLLLLLLLFQSYHSIPCFSSFLFQNLSRNRPFHAYQTSL